MLVALFIARLDPDDHDQGRAAALASQLGRSDRRRREPRRGPDPAQLPVGDRRDPAHQLLPAERGVGRCEALPLIQARSRARSRLLPLPRPRFEIFVLLAARRGRAPARRHGRARRPALVGPARGFPHRGPRPDEGADGQERADRPGRVQGRLRGQAPADEGGREAFQAEGIACYRTFLRGPARPHRQHRRRRGRAADRGRALRRRRSLPGGRRRQGHGDLLRHRQRRRRPTTASGSATRSPPAARSATTTRRWGSPRAAPGSRSSGTSASSAPTSRRPTSPSSASATWRATCSATACCSRRTSGCSPRSTTCTSSSTPTRTPAASFAERQRLFELPRSAWSDYDASLISAGGGVFERSAKSIPISAGGQRALGIEADELAAERADLARSCGRRSTCSGTAASAPTSRRAAEIARRRRRQGQRRRPDQRR